MTAFVGITITNMKIPVYLLQKKRKAKIGLAPPEQGNLNFSHEIVGILKLNLVDVTLKLTSVYL